MCFRGGVKLCLMKAGSKFSIQQRFFQLRANLKNHPLVQYTSPIYTTMGRQLHLQPSLTKLNVSKATRPAGHGLIIYTKYERKKSKSDLMNASRVLKEWFGLEVSLMDVINKKYPIINILKIGHMYRWTNEWVDSIVDSSINVITTRSIPCQVMRKETPVLTR